MFEIFKIILLNLLSLVMSGYHYPLNRIPKSFEMVSSRVTSNYSPAHAFSKIRASKISEHHTCQPQDLEIRKALAAEDEGEAKEVYDAKLKLCAVAYTYTLKREDSVQWRDSST